MLGRPAVERAAAADFEMVRADGGRADGQDQHDPQYDQRQEESVATIGSALAADDRRKEAKEGEAHNDGGDVGHDHASHLQASTSTLSSSDSKSARDEQENCCQNPQNQKHRTEKSTEDP